MLAAFSRVPGVVCGTRPPLWLAPVGASAMAAGAVLARAVARASAGAVR